MEMTKFAHACFSVEKNNQTIIVDPGNWTDDLVIPPNVVGVVITHEHDDHCDRELLADIFNANPKARLYAHKDVTDQLTHFPTQSVQAGETVQVGDFALTFVGGEHAVIDSTMEPLANLGVLIDKTLYYPGDSFSLPNQPVETLAVPASAPWMKFSEAADFIRSIKPTQVFPTHDALLSDVGKQLADSMLGDVCADVGAAYKRL